MRSPNVLLVEGTDDVHVVLHLLYQHGFKKAESIVAPERYVIEHEASGGPIHIKDKDGYSGILKDLRLELTPTHLRRLAVILDADSDARLSRCRRRRPLLRQHGAGSRAEPRSVGLRLARFVRAGYP